MTSFHAFLGCSLDGYIAGPNGELDWLTAYESTGYDDFFASIDALAMGRGTYEVMLGFGVDYYGGKPIHVLSRTLPPGPLPDMGRSSVTAQANIPALQAALAAAQARRVYVDGGRAVQGFLAEGLLSDLTVTRVPVLLGDGIPLFGALPAPVQAHLVESHATDDGVVQSIYSFPVATRRA